MAEFKKFVPKEPVLAYQWSDGDKSIPTVDGIQPVRDGDYIVLEDKREKTVTSINDKGKVQAAKVSDQHLISIVAKDEFEAEFSEAQ